MDAFNLPLNLSLIHIYTILYGPPGTGKTYNSIFYSVGIIEKNRIIFKIKNNNEDILKKFKEYKDKNLIKFITCLLYTSIFKIVHFYSIKIKIENIYNGIM